MFSEEQLEAATEGGDEVALHAEEPAEEGIA